MKKIGRQVLFIGSKHGNPRNGEGSFVRLKNGTIMFGYTSFFGDSFDDDATARICAVFSSDEGETWSQSRVLFEKPENAGNIMSLSFLRMNNGDIGAFYIVKNFDRTDKIVFRRSADEGETWSDPINTLDCLDEADYYVINNDRVLKLRSGRILFAAARHTVLNTDKDFTPGVICFSLRMMTAKAGTKSIRNLPVRFPQIPTGTRSRDCTNFPTKNCGAISAQASAFSLKPFQPTAVLPGRPPSRICFFLLRAHLCLLKIAAAKRLPYLILSPSTFCAPKMSRGEEHPMSLP